MRSVRLLLGVVAVAVGIAACGGDDGSGSVKSGGSTTTTPTTSPPGTTTSGSATADAFVGLTKQAAIAKAEREGRPWRIGREDDEQFALTQDYFENRVTSRSTTGP